MEYMVTIRDIAKQVLILEGPFSCVPDAVTYLIANRYFTPPNLPHYNAKTVIDSKGVARIYIARSTAGSTGEMAHIAENVFSISISRTDHIAASEQRRSAMKALLSLGPKTSSKH